MDAAIPIASASASQAGVSSSARWIVVAVIMVFLWWLWRWLRGNVLDTSRKRKLATGAIVVLVAVIVALFFHPNQPTRGGEQPLGPIRSSMSEIGTGRP